MSLMTSVKGWVSEKMDSMLGTAAQTSAPVQQATPNVPASGQQNTAQTSLVPATNSTPATQPASEQTIVTGQFIPDGAMAGLSMSDAQRHTEKFRELVEQFDEDKQTPLEWGIRQLATIFCYVSPFILGFFIGMAVGDKFAQGQSSFWMQAGVHFLSSFLELLMPILGLSATITFKRALKDRSAIATCIAVTFFFLAVSVANAFALLFLLESGGFASVTSGSFAASVAVLGRSFGPLILDIGAAIYLSIANVRSLKKYLADSRQKIQAVKEVNAVNIELDEATMKAALDRVQAVSEMKGKQQRMETLNEAERLTHQAVIASMKKKLMDDNGDDRSGRSRYGGWS